MSLVNKAIQLLRRDILETEEQNLPPLRVLSGKYGISLVVVRDAALELRSQGLLRFSRGTKLRIIRQDDTSTTIPRRISAAQRIYELLRDSIKKGEYRTGDPLPKQGYIAAHMHVSTRTVTAAYSRLIEERLAHPRGKTRIVGPAVPYISRSKHPPAFRLCHNSKNDAFCKTWCSKIKDLRRFF